MLRQSEGIKAEQELAESKQKLLEEEEYNKKQEEIQKRKEEIIKKVLEQKLAEQRQKKGPKKYEVLVPQFTTEQREAIL